MTHYQKPPELYDGLRLHQNENTGGCSPKVIAALARLRPDQIGFYPPYGSDFVGQYWNGKPDFGSADLVVVDVAPRPNINAVLAHGFSITGRITDASDPTRGLANATVSAYTPAGFQYVASAVAGSDGSYALFLPSGDYIVFFGYSYKFGGGPAAQYRPGPEQTTPLKPPVSPGPPSA